MIQTFHDLYRKHHFEDRPTEFCQLWHYTSADGLFGIIRNKPSEYGKLHFWFTRSDCLNDTSEGVDILRTFGQVCAKLLDQNIIDKSFYDCIINEKIPSSQFISFPIPAHEDYTSESVLDCVECDVYICSFSLKEDSLDMWRYYSKGNGGYGLKCYPFLFDKYKEYEYSKYQEDAMFSKIHSYKVIYEHSQKEKILKDIIVDTFSAYTKSSEPESEKRKNAQAFIRYALKQFQFQFKHECYASEQEYRFVFYRPHNTPRLLKNKMPDIQFRTQNGIIVPYIDIVIEDGYSYLSEIWISPYIENVSIKTTVMDYLNQCEFHECQVKQSDLPVRK